MIEILRGLNYVHNATTPSGRALGIVHRDVTPSNVYINTAGGVKLGDFGVAKLVGVEGWTMTGSLKGKLGYLAPEQIEGVPPSQTIDLWAASVIFFELLSGQRAFTGSAELEVMLRIKKAKLPKLRKLNKSAPKELEKILLKALHRKPHKRFSSAGAMLAELEAFRQRAGRVLEPPQLITELSTMLA
jgi:serine/threonine-protein kinase